MRFFQTALLALLIFLISGPVRGQSATDGAGNCAWLAHSNGCLASPPMQETVRRAIAAAFSPPLVADAGQGEKAGTQGQANPPDGKSIQPSLGDLGFPSAQTQGNAQEQARLDKRSHMLRIHQRLGLITVAPLVATVLTGAMAGGRQTSSTDRDLHAALGSATAGLYFATAYYSIFAPRIAGTHTRGPIKLHKVLAFIHGPGMVLTPILGAMAFDQKSRGEKVHGIASAHGAVAVITAGAYGLAIASVSIHF